MKPGVPLLWFHVALFGIVSLAGYLGGDLLFGPASLLQTTALSALLLSATLLALAVLLAVCAREGSPALVKFGLLAAFLLDIQVPVMMFRYPAIFEYMEADRGLPWFLVPLFFLLLAMVTAYQLSRAWRPATAT